MKFFARLFAIVIILCPTAVLADPYQGVISDGHAHFKGKQVWPDETIEAMDRNNIDVMVLWVKQHGGWNDDNTLAFAARYPDRVIPGIAFQHDGWKAQSTDFVEEVREKAKSGYFKAMGEISFRGKIGGKLNAPADSPLAREILDIADKYQMPTTIHHNPYRWMSFKWKRTDEYEIFIEKTLAYNTNATVIWDHWCGQSTPEDARKLLNRFPNLICGLSWLHKPLNEVATPLIDEHGEFSPDWKNLIEHHPDRFIIGIDGKSSRGSLRKFDGRVRMIRKALGGLSPRAVVRVATKNLHRLYRLKKRNNNFESIENQNKSLFLLSQ